MTLLSFLKMSLYRYRLQTKKPCHARDSDSSTSPLAATLSSHALFSRSLKHASPCCSAWINTFRLEALKSFAWRILSISSPNSCVTVRRYHDEKSGAADAWGGRFDADDVDTDDGGIVVIDADIPGAAFEEFEGFVAALLLCCFEAFLGDGFDASSPSATVGMLVRTLDFRTRLGFSTLLFWSCFGAAAILMRENYWFATMKWIG